MPKRKNTGKPAGRPNDFTEAQVETALRECQGWMAFTAQRLGCSYQTVVNYLNKYPRLVEVRNELKHVKDDHCSSKLSEQINTGNMTAIIWYQKTQMGMTDQPQGNPNNPTELKPRRIIIECVDASKKKEEKK